MLAKLALIVAFFPFIEASAVTPRKTIPHHAQQQGPNCQNPGGVHGIDPSCWNTLGMTKYTQDWWAKNSADCTGLGFSTCFLQKNNLGTRDCTGIKPGACPVPDAPKNGSAQEFYVLYNIYSINQVFNSLYSAVGNAGLLASDSIGAIVTLLDPPQQTNVLLDDLLTALSAGLALIPGAESEIINLVVHTAQQIPGVAKYLFPTGTTQTQIDQWASMANEVGTLVKTYQTNVSQIIPTVNNDVENFITFASTGSFCAFPAPDASVESNTLLKGIHTYIVGQVLAQNNIKIVRAVDTDINALQLNSSDGLTFDTGCGKGYDADGVCGSFWYDANAKVTYGLDNYKTMTKQYHDELGAIFGNWTSGDLLFGGAARCAVSGGPKGSLAQTIVGPDGVVTPDCLSYGKICTFDVNSLDVDHEFTDCPSQPGYLTNGCTGRCGTNGDTVSVNVPNAYMGGYLQSGVGTCVCNT